MKTEPLVAHNLPVEYRSSEKINKNKKKKPGLKQGGRQDSTPEVQHLTTHTHTHHYTSAPPYTQIFLKKETPCL